MNLIKRPDQNKPEWNGVYYHMYSSSAACLCMYLNRIAEPLATHQQRRRRIRTSHKCSARFTPGTAAVFIDGDENYPNSPGKREALLFHPESGGWFVRVYVTLCALSHRRQMKLDRSCV